MKAAANLLTRLWRASTLLVRGEKEELDTQIEHRVALVLAAHGDRGGDAPNERLFAHVAALTERHKFASVTAGVLNGEPSLEEALQEADASGAAEIVVYPMFMSAGYFVKTVLADRVSAAGLRTPAGIMQPLGLDNRLALLMLENALRASKTAKIDPAGARLLIIGHGSKQGSENANATKRAARLLSPHSPFARVETAFLEEAPLVGDALRNYDGISVVSGFLTGEGLHAGEDIPDAIKESGARALYTGPIGAHPRVSELIASAIHTALGEGEEKVTPEPQPKVTPKPESVEPTKAGEPAAVQTEKENQPEASVAPAEPSSTGVREEVRSEPKKRSGRRRGGALGLLSKVAVALILIAVLAIGAVSFLFPEDAVRERVASLVKQQTGRSLTIRGGTSFSVFPSVGLELEDVSISNPPGMAAGETLRVESLNVYLKLLPLVSRRVEVDRIVLERPVFNLVVDAKGRKNWEAQKAATLLLPEARDVASGARSPLAGAHLAQAGGGAVKDISLGTVKISEGTLNYSDQVTGARHKVEAINVTVVQPEVTAPLDLDGDLVWKKEKVSFEGRVDRPSALMNEKATKTRMSVSSRFGDGGFDGQIAAAPSFTANGAVKGNTKSLRGLLSWLGDPLPPGGGLGAASISGHLGFVGETMKFTKAKLGIDGMQGTGQLSVRLKGVRPHLKASLAFDKLDLNPYVAGAQGTGTPASAPQSAPPAAPTPSPQENESLTDFINKLNKSGETAPNPQVRAWSQEAIDYTGLRTLDADMNLTTNEIYYRKIKTGRGDVTANIRSGVLTADLTQLQLYSGTGTGRVTLNGARATPGVAALFNLSNISALPLMRDAAEFTWISGRANMSISVSGNGRSQSEIMRSLQGQGQFAFANGSIEGINIPAMVRGLKEGRFDDWKRGDRQKTDFSQLTMSFTISQGVATNKDLQLVGPLVRATGEGIIDIGNEQLDYSALPRLVASLEGQGTQVDPNRGIRVPIKIKGSWENPKVKVDLERMMNDPELAQDAINEVGKALENIKNKDDLNNVLKGLLGGGQQGGGGPQGGDGAQEGGDGAQGGQGQQVNPGDLLKNLFRQ
jgi:AsmA protein